MQGEEAEVALVVSQCFVKSDEIVGVGRIQPANGDHIAVHQLGPRELLPAASYSFLVTNGYVAVNER